MSNPTPPDIDARKPFIAATIRRCLECLWWRGQPMFLYGFALISFSLVHVHEFLIPVDSDDICSASTFVDAMSWIIPKLRTDCMLVATSLASHPYKDAAILLDLGIFLMVVLTTGIAVTSDVMKISNYERIWLKPYRRRGNRRKIVAISVLCFFFVVMMAIMLFVPMLTLPPRSAIMAALWGHGIGAAFQTIAFCMWPLILCTVTLGVGGRRSLHTEVNDEQ